MKIKISDENTTEVWTQNQVFSQLLGWFDWAITGDELIAASVPVYRAKMIEMKESGEYSLTLPEDLNRMISEALNAAGWPDSWLKVESTDEPITGRG